MRGASPLVPVQQWGWDAVPSMFIFAVGLLQQIDRWPLLRGLLMPPATYGVSSHPRPLMACPVDPRPRMACQVDRPLMAWQVDRTTGTTLSV